MQNASLLIGLCLILALAPNGWKDCFEKRSDSSPSRDDDHQQGGRCDNGTRKY